MKDTKLRYEWLSFYNRSELERRLAQMAEKGWLLDGIGQVFWSYRRIEPKKLTFSVCYFPEASSFDPEPSEEQRTFYDFCAHAGWKLTAARGQLQVFYNEGPDPVPIETDPVAEVDSIHQMAKKSFLPHNLGVMAVLLLYGWLLTSLWNTDPVRVLTDGSLLWAGIALLGLFVMCALDVGRYCLWHARAKKAAEWGELLPSPGRFQLDRIFYLWMVVSLAASLLSVPRFTAAVIGVRVLGGCGIVALIVSARQWLKREKEPAGKNRAITLGLGFILSLLVVTAAVWLEREGTNRNWFGDGCATYEQDGRTYVDHQDGLPLTLEDLMSPGYDRYIRELRVNESPLAAKYVIRQGQRYGEEYDGSIPELSYRIVQVKVPALYGLCRESLLRRWDYVPADPAPWGAAEAYCWPFPNGAGNVFLLCYESRIVEITFDFEWDGTPTQMAKVGEKLGG
ncbi:MAG: DUF2812 domain-containing protein [Oscillospiraceae bacterium]|nr:DUF2812 domain-containing protein [Oscillospiraceae bacterium]